jgi:hypothetical protein
MLRFDAVRSCARGFKEANDTVPQLYPGILKYCTVARKPLVHPGLFGPQAAITLCDAIWAKSDSAFVEELYLPALPFEECVKPGASPLLKTIFYAINETCLEFPLDAKINGEALRDDSAACKSAGQFILMWLDEGIDILQTEKALISGKIPPDYLLKMIRGLWFVHEACPQILNHNIYYFGLLNSITSISVMRYCIGFLRETAIDAVQKFARDKRMKNISEKLLEVIDGWVSYSAKFLPETLLVSTYYNLSIQVLMKLTRCLQGTCSLEHSQVLN